MFWATYMQKNCLYLHIKSILEEGAAGGSGRKELKCPYGFGSCISDATVQVCTHTKHYPRLRFVSSVSANTRTACSALKLNMERINVTSAIQLPTLHPKVSRPLILNQKIMLHMLGRVGVSKLNRPNLPLWMQTRTWSRMQGWCGADPEELQTSMINRSCAPRHPGNHLRDDSLVAIPVFPPMITTTFCGEGWYGEEGPSHDLFILFFSFL